MNLKNIKTENKVFAAAIIVLSMFVAVVFSKVFKKVNNIKKIYPYINELSERFDLSVEESNRLRFNNEQFVR